MEVTALFAGWRQELATCRKDAPALLSGPEGVTSRLATHLRPVSVFGGRRSQMPSVGEFTRYNPDAEWKPYVATVPFFGHSAVVYVSLSKINAWSDDVAAYAVIWKVYRTSGPADLPGGDDMEAHPSMGHWSNIEKVEMRLYLYGPVLARATLLGLYTS